MVRAGTAFADLGHGMRLIERSPMAMRLAHTTRSQLTLIQMITCTLAVCSVGIVIGVLDYYRHRDAALQDLLGLAEAIARNSEAALTFGIEEDAKQILRIVAVRDSVNAAYIYDDKGAVFASFVPSGHSPSSYAPPIEGRGHVLQNRHVRVYHPIDVRGERIGTVGIEDSLETVREAARRNAAMLAIVMSGALLLALATAARLQTLISRPILALARTARNISSEGDYSQRADLLGSDEIVSLKEAFNEMLRVIQQRDRDLSEEIRIRSKVEGDLRNHRDQLEELVMARTEELERANLDLRNEIQEHERAERLLRRTLTELETTNSELERFAQVAAHDLQEPLRKMLAFGDRLRSTKGTHLSEQADDYLTRLTQSAHQMQFLINDLLEFSKLGRRKPAFRSVDLNGIVDQALKELRDESDAAGASIRVGVLPTIDAEHPQMLQLFRHLISNAIKFRRSDTPLFIEIATTATDDDKMVSIAIKDNGMGFDQKYASRIFEIFQRLHARHVYEGTGIGLAICQRITDVHGGTITATAAPDMGSTFTLTLPKTQQFDRET